MQALLGLLLLLVGAGTIAIFVVGTQLCSLAPSAEDAWKYVEEKGVRIADHTEVFQKFNVTKYEGSKTCLKCHEKEVRDLVHSYHYRLINQVDDVAGKGVTWAGSRTLYNDFCGAIFWNGNVSVNFIGKAVLKKTPPGKEELKGKLIATGCSMCHGVSLGKIPSVTPTKEDLENVDCLVCHSNYYKGGAIGVKKGMKVVVKTEKGWRYVPNIPIEKAAKIVAKPSKDACLACHAFAGGGPHFKRPNLSPDLMGTVSVHFDVHMARGLHCVDCHKFEDHKVGTKAVGTWSREAEAVACTDCHKERHRAPIVGFIIENFHHKVACQTCHIPYIAHGQYPIDVERDWRHIEFNEKLGRWEPKLVLKKNVKPAYLWWNGKERKAYLYPDPVNGNEIVYAAPVGSEEDGKIYPFREHVAYVPFDEQKRIPIPIKVGVVFALGDVNKAVQMGAQVANLTFTGKFIKMVRYMNVDHGVVPVSESLKCVDCHSPWSRLPLEELGYWYPPIIYYGSPVVALIGLALLVLSLRKK
ncbi:cytochrome c3 family protein [Ignicoccus islandicus]|nr:cytochrome c3 family protein [Ignicoccus islandicus]